MSAPSITLVNRGGLRLAAHFRSWTRGSAGAGKSQCELLVVGRTGIPSQVTCSLSNGWCAKPADDWRMSEESQDAMLEWARKEGRKIGKTPRSTGRKYGKRPPKVDPRQASLFSLVLSVLLAGCASSYIPMTQLNISRDFSPRGMEVIIQTAEHLCEVSDDGCIPVSIGKGRGGYIRPAKKKMCKGDSNGFGDFSIIKAPVISICTDRLDDRQLAWVVAHEMIHSLRPDRVNWHPDGALVMDSKIQDGELRFNEVDIEYLEGA